MLTDTDTDTDTDTASSRAPNMRVVPRRLALVATTVGLAVSMTVTGCSSTAAGAGQSAPVTTASSATAPASESRTVTGAAVVPQTPRATDPAVTSGSTDRTPANLTPTRTTATVDPAPSGVTPAPAKSTPLGSPVDPNAQLNADTPGQQHAQVTASTGALEAVSYDQAGHLTFWSYLAGAWTRTGSSTYPYNGTEPAHAQAQGRLLPGMIHPTFIVTGLFSGDGTGDAVAYTDGPAGWGAITAQRDGDIGPSGHGVTFGGLGLSSGLYFVDGELETADCSATLITADCGGDRRVLKFWRWNGAAFTLTRRAGLLN